MATMMYKLADVSKRLILHGFFNKARLYQDFPEWSKWDAKKRKAALDKLKDEQVERYADHDEMEVARDQIMKTPYPKPLARYFLIYEVPHESIEPIYYWLLNHVSVDWAYPIVHKVTDVFTPAEHSSFYGASAQRLGLAQDKVAQYLATIGKMIKDMFQLVRELRWIDERKKYYEDAEKGLEGAEISLKGLWTDMVDGVVGGQRTSSNLFVMAQQLQFSALPDIFFSVHVTKHIASKLKGKALKDVTSEDVRNLVDQSVEKQAGGFNKELRNLLKRKLYQYLVWKDETWLELMQRRRFTLDYLRQHYHVIKMYMNWVKPYLRHIQKLGADVRKINAAELISSFEGSLIEIEILAQKLPLGAAPTPIPNKLVHAVILLNFEYRTRPQMQFSQEGGYHRGPLHQGESKITWRAYAWTQEQIDNYLKMKDSEDLELIKSIDDSLRAAMDALGDDLRNYLDEAELMHKVEEKEGKAPEKRPGILEPFAEIAKGFTDTFTAILPKKGSAADKKKIQEQIEKEKGNAVGEVTFTMWQTYKNFKKAHRIIAW